PSKSPERQVPLDPDVPIPSTEDSLDELSEEEEGSVIITRIPESEIDFYEDSDLDFEEEEEDKAQLPADTDSESHYSDPEPLHPEPLQPEAKSQEVREEVTTPRATTPTQKRSLDDSLPEFGSEGKDASFSRDFESYMLPEPETPKEPEEPVKEDKQPEPEAPKMADAHAFLQRPFTPEQPLSKPEYDGTGWGDPEDEYDEDPGTPESVIHHPIPADDVETPEQPALVVSPAIPERSATIKATGSKLKTRLSNTPSDISAMREARRQVSVEVPDVPPIPDKHAKRLSKDMNNGLLTTGDEFLERHPSFKNRSLTLDLDLGLSLDQDFERVIEAQKVAFDNSFLQQSLVDNDTPSRQASAARNHQHVKDLNANITSRRQRGYLMRQNTKLVTASDKDADEPRGARSVGNSPVKQDRPMSCIVEPWNSKPRPRSVRKRVGGSIGPAPPLPGQESNATTVNHAPEEDFGLEMATPESGERGRLFVKVMGVKDLDLPLPKNERTWFSLTLDNGVHCVTTAWLELARNAPIGQEFELVVPNDLEFQLTLNVKLEKPVERARPPPPAAKVHKHKTSTFSRVFASPKKRKELELRQREEEERAAQVQRDAQAKQRNTPPSSYELLAPLAAEDGSFARAYVCLREHENRCFGRPYMAEVACFNEWATEEAGFASSVKSKRGNTAVVRRAPYKIGKLELQLLFVPRPKNATDDDMPKSMNSCIRELKAAEERMSRNWEGHLSQQGGDCPYWRRRYFKLIGTKLTAYHEATRQPRATINLANAKRLIDDRRALTEKETTGKGGRRRRSAFAEDEEGYMFVEEGFRIRFNNGELIDFYADTAEDKEGWMKVLADVVGRESSEDDASGPRARSRWCQLVLRREEQLRRRASGRRVNSRPKRPAGRPMTDLSALGFFWIASEPRSHLQPTATFGQLTTSCSRTIPPTSALALLQTHQPASSRPAFFPRLLPTPSAIMAGRFVRASKYRHVFGKPTRKEFSYDNIHISRNAWDTNLVKVNPEYLSVNWDSSGGGAFAVIPLSERGKVPDQIPLFRGHTAAVLDTDWNPFHDNIIASASEDGKVFIWEVPQGFTLHTDAEEIIDVAPVSKLTGHSRKVGQVLFNPSAENILASASGDFTVKIWDIGTGQSPLVLKHNDIVQSLSWNASGSMLVTTSRDKKIRVWDVRQEKPVHEAPGHGGAKNSRAVWMGEHNRFATTGFSRMSERQIALWEPGRSEPIGGFTMLDSISGVCMPFWDDGSNCLYLAGKGDGNIRYFEYENDKFEFLSEYKSADPQRGIAFMPRRGINVHDNEVMRAYKTVNDAYVEPISFTVPRRAETFQADIFPPAIGTKPAASAQEWLGGKTGIPNKIDLESLYEGTVPKEIASAYKAPAAAPAPVAEKPAPKKEEPKEEPKPAPAVRSSPPSMNEQKGSIAAMASRYQDKEVEDEDDEDETSSFEEVSRPAQRQAAPAAKSVPPTQAQTTPATSAAPFASTKPSSPIKSSTAPTTSASASRTVSSSAPQGNNPSLAEVQENLAKVESQLGDLQKLVGDVQNLANNQGEQMQLFTTQIQTLIRLMGSNSQSQSERIRQLELELEEARS
ncbi:hypothetical protein FALBO_14054, partial [Fusarium albosuccineum]